MSHSIDIHFRKPDKSRRSTDSAHSTKSSVKDRRRHTKCRPKKLEQSPSTQHHKLRDFAFDIESYAKVDPRDAAPAPPPPPATAGTRAGSEEHMPVANA